MIYFSPDQMEALRVALNFGYEDVLKNYREKFGFVDFEDKSQIPIGYSKLETKFPFPIQLSEDIKKYINEKVDVRTNNGLDSCEFPFFLLGNYEFLDEDNLKIKITNTIDGNNEFEQEKVSYSPSAVSMVKKGLDDKQFNIVVIGHSHPKLSKEMEEKESEKIKAAREYTNTIRDELGIRETGLNISIQDIFQLIAFTNSVKDMFGKALVMGCIYNFNGEFNFIHYDGEEICIANDVSYFLDNGNVEKVDNYFTKMNQEKEKSK